MDSCTCTKLNNSMIYIYVKCLRVCELVKHVRTLQCNCIGLRPKSSVGSANILAIVQLIESDVFVITLSLSSLTITLRNCDKFECLNIAHTYGDVRSYVVPKLGRSRNSSCEMCYPPLVSARALHILLHTQPCHLNSPASRYTICTHKNSRYIYI